MSLLIDSFSFFDELELLAFRLKELSPVVDKFVLVESDLTHSGQKKPLYYEENKHLFSEYKDRVIHVIHRGLTGDNVDPWLREAAQRDAILEGLKRIEISGNDYVVISDCDEIPRAELLAEIKKYGFNIFVNPQNRKYLHVLDEASIDGYNFEEEVFGLLQDFYYYNLECKHAGSIWWQSRIVTYQKLLELELPTRVRLMDIDKRYYGNGGWHFSYFGGTSRIMKKIRGFAHQELNTPEYLDKQKIEQAINNKEDLYGRDFVELEHIPVALNDNLPTHYEMLLKFSS